MHEVVTQYTRFFWSTTLRSSCPPYAWVQYGAEEPEEEHGEKLARQLSVFHISGQIHGFVRNFGQPDEQFTYPGNLDADLAVVDEYPPLRNPDRIAAKGYLARKIHYMLRLMQEAPVVAMAGIALPPFELNPNDPTLEAQLTGLDVPQLQNPQTVLLQNFPAADPRRARIEGNFRIVTMLTEIIPPLLNNCL